MCERISSLLLSRANWSTREGSLTAIVGGVVVVFIFHMTTIIIAAVVSLSQWYSMLKAEMPTFEYKFPGDSYRAVHIIAIEHVSTNAQGRGGCKLTIGEGCEIF